MLVYRFIYDLVGAPKPNDEELEEEIDRLLYIQTAEVPNYIVAPDNRDQVAALDSEILSLWLTKKFKIAFIMLFINHTDNRYLARQELSLMDRYNMTKVDKFLRSSFLEKHAMERVREAYFSNSDIPSLEHCILDLKKTLTFIAEHLQQNGAEFTTLLGTDAYTSADVTLYNFLKRTLVGKYRNFGLQSHVKLCDPLIRFMRRYASKNIRVIDVTHGDPLANRNDDSSFVAEFVKSAVVGLGFIIFFLWSKRG